ncbi:MAG: glycosyltransferase [Opitutaceae bacterium]|nr:glycosyltransferase [Verrucomicrobiales bacterium]
MIWIISTLAWISFGITLWQWWLARRFPLHQRAVNLSFSPAVTILKPLKGCDAESRVCLESWFKLSHPASVQLIFGVAAPDDPICAVVRELIAQHPAVDATIVIASEQHGANAKVSTLIQLARHARHDVLITSDADVLVEQDLVTQLVQPLKEPTVGLVCSFYRLANPTTLAARWEAIGMNADFWTQVLQARSLQRMKFALGAAMAVRRDDLMAAGGFEVLAGFLADDYQLGQRLAANGRRIELCPIPVDCRETPLTWRDAWQHQLRWARTIRACQPFAFFLSIVGNATFWPLLWLAVQPQEHVWHMAAIFILLRIVSASQNQRKMNLSNTHWRYDWLVPIKDLLGVILWITAQLGNEVTWRGDRFRVDRGGRLTRVP